MPASNARALEKARTLPADVIILDLEDAVAPDAKKTAREQAAAAIKARGFGPREVVLRTNGLDTAWIDEDQKGNREQRRDQNDKAHPRGGEPSSEVRCA